MPVKLSRALTQSAKAAGVKPNAAYVQEVTGLKEKWERQLKDEVFQQVPGEAMSQGQLIGVLNNEAKSGDIIIGAAGSPPGDLMKIWDASNGRACQLEFGYSCMAYEIPAGLGARMAQADGEIYVFIGDGTYLMNPTEIVTAAQEGLKITIVISENHGYQCIRGLQLARAGQSFGNEFRSRDKKTNRLEGEYLKIDLPRTRRAWAPAPGMRIPRKGSERRCRRHGVRRDPASSSWKPKNIDSCQVQRFGGTWP